MTPKPSLSLGLSHTLLTRCFCVLQAGGVDGVPMSPISTDPGSYLSPPPIGAEAPLGAADWQVGGRMYDTVDPAQYAATADGATADGGVFRYQHVASLLTLTVSAAVLASVAVVTVRSSLLPLPACSALYPLPSTLSPLPNRPVHRRVSPQPPTRCGTLLLGIEATLPPHPTALSLTSQRIFGSAGASVPTQCCGSGAVEPTGGRGGACQAAVRGEHQGGIWHPRR